MGRLNQFLAIVSSEIGKPYVYDASGPNSFDCSGLVTYAAAQVGISLPHNAAQQQRTTTPVKSPLPGDLVFFGQPAYHVGIYVGGGKMISAPSPGQVVHLVDVGSPTGYGRISGLGTALSSYVDTGQQLVGKSTGVTGAILSGANAIVYEGLFVALGLGLLAMGAWQAAKPHLHQPKAI